MVRQGIVPLEVYETLLAIPSQPKQVQRVQLEGVGIEPTQALAR